MKLAQPWPGGYSINTRSPYGWRIHPITGKRKFHQGVDVALPVGTVLKAPADGQIVHKGNGPSGGYTLIIRHAPDLYTVYYHLQKPSHLLKGTKVEAGEDIALSGNTGASTGPHLHWEVRRSRTWGDTVDPIQYLEMSAPPEPPKPEPVKPVVARILKPSRLVKAKPMSPGLRRFFQIRKALR